MQAQHVGEVSWKILQEGFLGGTRVPEDGSQAQLPQQVEGGVSNSRSHGKRSWTGALEPTAYCRTNVNVSVIIWSALVV